MKASKQEREEALARLRAVLKPGDTVYTILRHVSRSGMQRSIGLVYVKDNVPSDWITGQVAKVLGWALDRDRYGVKVSGCGMDMGFHLVYSLSHALFPKGFGCVGERCPSNDHSNGDRDYSLHHAEREHWHKDGGYALLTRWL